MARTSVLPLPDAAVRHILAHVDELRATFPTTQGNRPFLAAFIRLIYNATGDIYGANVTRKLLQTYAGEYRPSSGTIHSELQALRTKLKEEPQQFAPASPDTSTQSEPIVSPATKDSPPLELGNLAALIAGLQRTIAHAQTGQAVDTQHLDALTRALEAENQRLRVHTEHLTRSLETAESEKQQVQLEMESTQTERDTYKKVADELIGRVEQLSEAVKQADERTAASHRFALGRIEDATAELRRQKELVKEAKEETAAVQKQLRDEQSMTDALRRALNTKRNEEI